MFRPVIGAEFVMTAGARKAVIMRGGKSLVVLALGGAGVLGVTGCGAKAATADLTAAVTRTTAQTARIAVTTTMQMQGMTVSFTESGAFDFAHSRGTLSMASPVGFTEVFVPPRMYIKMPASAGASLPKDKSWIAADTVMSGISRLPGSGALFPARSLRATVIQRIC
jgi:hypothetical protein